MKIKEVYGCDVVLTDGTTHFVPGTATITVNGEKKFRADLMPDDEVKFTGTTPNITAVEATRK